MSYETQIFEALQQYLTYRKPENFRLRYEVVAAGGGDEFIAAEMQTVYENKWYNCDLCPQIDEVTGDKYNQRERLNKILASNESVSMCFNQELLAWYEVTPFEKGAYIEYPALGIVVVQPGIIYIFEANYYNEKPLYTLMYVHPKEN